MYDLESVMGTLWLTLHFYSGIREIVEYVPYKGFRKIAPSIIEWSNRVSCLTSLLPKSFIPLDEQFEISMRAVL